MVFYAGRKIYYENEEKKSYKINEIKLGGESLIMINDENILEKEIPYEKINSIKEITEEVYSLNISVEYKVKNI